VIGLHTLSSPVNEYPDGSLHPAPYDAAPLVFEWSRCPTTLKALPQWLALTIKAGRKPITIVDPLNPDPCAALAKQYPGNVWEIGNECSDLPYWSGTAQDYAIAYLLAQDAIKDADPTATVITCGVQGMQTGGHAAKWLHRVFDAIPRPWEVIDGVGVHLYPGDITEIDRIPEMLDHLRAVMAAHRLETKPIWNTECGILSPEFRALPRTIQTDAVRRVFRHARECHVNVWYAFDQHTMGFGASPEEFAESVAAWNEAVQ